MFETLAPEHCARMLRSLADPERLRIIDCLRHGPRNVSDIARETETDIVNTSHHLGVLRSAGLLLDQRQGRFVVYRLNPAIFAPTDGTHNQHLDLGCCRLEMPLPTEEN
jgi:ArsR family transcriptional regulator